jgi:hypothetical protein
MEFITGAVLGWAGKKLLAFAKGTGRFLVMWLRAAPQTRCYAAMMMYKIIMGSLVRSAPGIRSRMLIGWIKRFDNWCYPKLKVWQNRVQP